MEEKQLYAFNAENEGGLNEQAGENQGPVTVLGMTFANDEKRREYFREELRKKLPELRKIEGFPIGEDEDIIRLSDPPYYTACPNPWLNDFIAEWEEEKKKLEAEGKRKADFEVKEPYASDVSEGKNNPVYTAHTYHTKVPHPAIMRYILHYTQPGDIILDGFAGTGMTGVAAAACAQSSDETAIRISGEWREQFGKEPHWGARHAVIGDLSPYATNIAYFYNTPVDIKTLKAEAERILKEMEDECGWMYKTLEPIEKGTGKNKHIELVEGKITFVVWSDIMICPNCGHEYVFWNQTVDHKNECMLEEFACPHCGASQTKKTAHISTETYFDEALGKSMQRVKQVPVIVVGKAEKKKIQRAPLEYDLDLLKRIDQETITDFYPTDALPEGLKTRDPKVKLIYHTHQFYTKRNLLALSKLYAKIEASPLSHALRFLLTAVSVWCTKTSRVKINYYFHGGGGWNIGCLSNTLYIPGFPIETSIIDNFSNKISSAIRALEVLPKEYINLSFTNSASELSITENSIDYIFTDPPFGANINYSELNSLPEPWLRVVTNNSTEAVENPTQGKNAQIYREIMTQCFTEYYRVLKPGKWITVEFSNTSAAVWNSIQNALQSSGFIIANVSALDKKQGSFNAVTTTTAVKQDLVISCYKPSTVIVENIQSNPANEKNVWDIIAELLQHLNPHAKQGDNTTVMAERTPKLLFDKVLTYYVSRGLNVPMDAQDFQKGLREHFIERDGMFFTAEDAAKYDEERRKTHGIVPMGIIVSDEANGIEWLKNQLRDNPQTYQQIQPLWMQAIGDVRKGCILPELKTILEENFIEDDGGKWRIPNYEEALDLAKLHHKSLMRQFKYIVEMAQKPRARIKEANPEALREGFKQCFKDRDFATIMLVSEKIPQNMLTEDPDLLQYYDIAQMRV